MQHPYINIAIKAARRAGNIITRSLENKRSIQVSEKGLNDLVTTIDSAAEKDIIGTIRRAYPDHGILGEEGGYQAGDETVWVIDPLDGTMNFVHGYPQYAVSIGIRHKGQYEHGVIYDPLTQDLYTASKGKGTQLNGQRVRVSERSGLAGALLSTGFPYTETGRMKHLDRHLEMFKGIYQNCSDIRYSGSAALNLAYVASGKLDGYWQTDLKEWDIAAGLLMVQEAGGIVSDYTGAPDFSMGSLIAGTHKIHGILLDRIMNADLVTAL